jgi:hypothetical protein
MQNKLDKARELYNQVHGAYGEYAKQQVERLERPEAKDVADWLANAKPPAPQQPMGPGTPGQRPEFAPGELDLPAAIAPGTAAPATDGRKEASFDDVLKSLREEPTGTASPAADPYTPQLPATTESGTPPVTEGAPPTDAPPATEGAPPEPASDAASPPTEEPKGK